MNERIEQLAEQCWIHTNEPLFAAKSPHWEFDRQKFAELIVRECIDWCNAHATIDGTAQKIVESIKKDFGVEE